VITVPSDLILTPLAKLNEDSSLFKFLTNVLDGADTIQLVVRLLVEKFTLKSFWSPYIGPYQSISSSEFSPSLFIM
jgi:hypothetical protein